MRKDQDRFGQNCLPEPTISAKDEPKDQPELVNFTLGCIIAVKYILLHLFSAAFRARLLLWQMLDHPTHIPHQGPSLCQWTFGQRFGD